MTLKRSSWLYRYLTFGPFEVFNSALVEGSRYNLRRRERLPFTLTLCGLFWRMVFMTLGYAMALTAVGFIVAAIIATKGMLLLGIAATAAFFTAIVGVGVYYEERAIQKQQDLATLGEAARSAWKNTVCPIVRIED